MLRLCGVGEIGIGENGSEESRENIMIIGSGIAECMVVGRRNIGTLWRWRVVAGAVVIVRTTRKAHCENR